MSRVTRYQGAIVRDDHILLIKHQEHASGDYYWVVPGGGREDGETEEECVAREMKEETNLTVKVERLLVDEQAIPDAAYQRFKTFLCTPTSGEARPGFEPEVEAAEWYAITEVKWFDLRDQTTWGDDVRSDPFTGPLLRRIQVALGYSKD